MRTLIKETVSQIGSEVTLSGWIHTIRDVGKLAFLLVRDRSGIIQVIIADELYQAEMKNLSPESVVTITGTVKERGAKAVNPNMSTGTVEVLASSITILGPSATPPFPIDADTKNVNEELRLRYRYLDLRSERLQKNIRLRSQYVQKMREQLFGKDFVEIETPLLTQSTPEGSRDFIVPSRLKPGKFFALPQSPQQYKQLLMVAGFERYFQVARCIRDEDLRADRGFEHTQIDVEMSFVDREGVMQTIEDAVTKSVEALGFTIKEKPFPRVSYADSMKKYGADKFDLRSDEDKKNGVLAYAWVIDFPFFEKDNDGKWTFTHNPFSQPLPEYAADHLAGTNTEKILTSQYDLVCNGFEVGGGSIRAHRPEVLEATYRTMGYSDEEIKASVGHMIEAFKYGAPPHGGIGMGVERTIMNLTQEDHLREVQAFPMSASGNTSVMDAPSELSETQLREAHISLRKK